MGTHVSLTTDIHTDTSLSIQISIGHCMNTDCYLHL